VENRAGILIRLIAFAIDMLVLGIVGIALGAVATDAFAAMGPWGRLVGLAIGLGYFGYFDGAPGGGRSPGKRLLRLVLVGRDGRPLPVVKSAGRFLLIWIPMVLNGLPLELDQLSGPLGYLEALGTFGLGCVLIYLAIAGRKNGQALQDLLFGSVMLRQPKGQQAPDSPLEPAAISRRQRFISALLVLLSLTLPAMTGRLANQPDYQRMNAIAHAVKALDGVSVVGVAIAEGGKTIVPGTVEVRAFARTRQMLTEQQVKNIASAVHRTAPTAPEIQIHLSYGYDIGIASSWRSQYAAFGPAELAALR